MITSEAVTIQAKAEEVRAWFEKATRDSGESYWRTKDGSPDWLTELCHTAHGDMLPDDHRYQFIIEALDALAEEEDPDDAEVSCSVYTGCLTAWLASHADRLTYCDDARKDWGNDFKDLEQLLMLGQQTEMDEVLYLVRYWLERNLEEEA